MHPSIQLYIMSPESGHLIKRAKSIRVYMPYIPHAIKTKKKREDVAYLTRDLFNYILPALP